MRSRQNLFTEASVGSPLFPRLIKTDLKILISTQQTHQKRYHKTTVSLRIYKLLIVARSARTPWLIGWIMHIRRAIFTRIKQSSFFFINTYLKDAINRCLDPWIENGSFDSKLKGVKSDGNANESIRNSNFSKWLRCGCVVIFFFRESHIFSIWTLKTFASRENIIRKRSGITRRARFHFFTMTHNMLLCITVGLIWNIAYEWIFYSISLSSSENLRFLFVG